MMRRRGGIVRGVARTAAVAGTASAVSGRVHRRQQNKWAAQDQQEMAQQQVAYNQGVADAQPAPPPPPAPAPAAGEDDTIAKLTQLGELHKQGVLNDDEFAAAKAKLLG